MLVEKLSRIFGKEEKENERVEELHQRLAERGFKLGLRLGREVFRCEDEPHCF